MSSNTDKSSTTNNTTNSSNNNNNSSLNPQGLKVCCACPETRKPRDECIIERGTDDILCVKLIDAHKECLLGLGFKV